MTDPILFSQPNICAVGTFIETPAPATACVNYKFSALQPHHGSSHGTTLTHRLVSWQSTKRWGARWYRDVVHLHGKKKGWKTWVFFSFKELASSLVNWMPASPSSSGWPLMPSLAWHRPFFSGILPKKAWLATKEIKYPWIRKYIFIHGPEAHRRLLCSFIRLHGNWLKKKAKRRALRGVLFHLLKSSAKWTVPINMWFHRPEDLPLQIKNNRP